MKHILIFLIRGYQAFVSPLFLRSCRFHPSCSEYSYQAIEKYGAGKGFILGIKRLMKCHPFNPGGYDPLI